VGREDPHISNTTLHVHGDRNESPLDGIGNTVEFDDELQLHGEYVRFSSSALDTKHVPRAAREPTPRLTGPEVSPEKFEAAPPKLEAPVKSNIATKPRTERREPRTEREGTGKSSYNSDLQRRVEVILSRNGQVSPHLSQRPVVLSRTPITSSDTAPSWALDKEFPYQRNTEEQLKLDALPRSLASPDRDTLRDAATPPRPPSRMHTRQGGQSSPKNSGEGCEAHRSGHQKISSPAAMNLEALRASAVALGRIAKGISRNNSGSAHAAHGDRAQRRSDSYFSIHPSDTVLPDSVTLAADIGHSAYRSTTSLSVQPAEGLLFPAPRAHAPRRRS
jgi:hypothetical protein